MVLLLCLMAYPVTGDTLHEWFGVAMTAALILHHVLNARWYGALFRGQYNAYRVVTVAVNTLLLAAIGLTALCGMAMSAHAVPFLYGLLPVALARELHLAMSHASFLLMGVHLGLHVPAMMTGQSEGWKRGLAIVSAAVAGVGFFLFLRSGMMDYILFRTSFAFFDYEKSILRVFMENLSMLTAFAFLGGQCASILQAIRRGNDRRKRLLFDGALLFCAALLSGALLLIYR